MKKLLNKKNFYLLIALFILILFGYITYKTPLSGDDWGYAINSTEDTPIKMAIKFYNMWSGRFFSELWGMIVPSHKWMWNIINPLLFFGIFICIYKLAYVKKKYYTIPLLIIMLMLTVEENLRMETYTWIMGTTYVIPLCFSLIYFLTIEKLFETNLYDKRVTIGCYLSNVLLFVIGLMMENIAATMIVGIVAMIIYAYHNKRKALKYLSINLIVSIVAFVIMRLSPGSASRLLSEHAAWANMTILEKITSAYPNFLAISFINNRYVISIFSIILILLIFYSKKEVSSTYKVISIIINILAIINVFSVLFIDSWLSDSSSIYSMIYWPLYVANAFVLLFIYLDNGFRKDKTIFMLMIGGCSALVMLYSPIYGSRSAIYLVYYLILVCAMLLEDININKKLIQITIFILLSISIIERTEEYISKYRLVGQLQEERLKEIDYYKKHPEEETAGFKTFSMYLIHGANIDWDDFYHLRTFKEYYDIPQGWDSIYFYSVEE